MKSRSALGCAVFLALGNWFFTVLMCYELCAVFSKWWMSFPYWCLWLEIRFYTLQICRKWGISSQITISNACCNSIPWQGTSAESWHKVLPTLYFSQLSGSCSRQSIPRAVCTGKELQSPPQPSVSGLMPSSCFLPFLSWEPLMAPSLLLSLRSYHYWLGHHCEGNLQQKRKHPTFQSSILSGILIKILPSPSPRSCSLCTLNFCSVGRKVNLTFSMDGPDLI